MRMLHSPGAGTTQMASFGCILASIQTQGTKTLRGELRPAERLAPLPPPDTVRLRYDEVPPGTREQESLRFSAREYHLRSRRYPQAQAPGAPLLIILHGCELRPSFDGSRCAPAWRCPHYMDCINQVCDETEWIGWEAEGENCRRYYRPSRINVERALQIMSRLWKTLSET